ncbi:triose-phosphate isomerase [Planosporangium thailandense]|uniref:Triosephosphate isomerase n=2 Tax=Planosporangium thailandense TaxID=765197 RepID=A0ABX0XRN4_9ACTN|nr:triose-phosphate isomerase [Planosporangium thailandense]
MNKTIAEARAYCRKLAQADLPAGVQVFVLPPFTSLAAASDELGPDSGVLVGAQNAHWADSGAWTGEISMPMARDAGAELVEIGHSERREHFGETDETVGLKVAAALRHGLVPLVCVGEPRAVRAAGDAEEYVLGQVEAAVAGIPAARIPDVIVAYEPVWAIGVGGTPATPELVAPVMGAIADRLSALTQGAGCRALLYGGGVDRANAPDLLRLRHVDGLFVGRAAWDVDGLLALVDLAARHREAERG